MQTLAFSFDPPRVPTTLNYSPYLVAKKYIIDELPKYRGRSNPFEACYLSLRRRGAVKMDPHSKHYLRVMLRAMYQAHQQRVAA